MGVADNGSPVIFHHFACLEQGRAGFPRQAITTQAAMVDVSKSGYLQSPDGRLFL
jgi:hypothetical protein